MIIICKTWFKDRLQEFLSWVTLHPVAGPFIICAATLIIVVLLLPYTLLAVGTGYAFTHVYERQTVVLSVGTACVFIGAWSGASIAFLLGRYIFRSKVKSVSDKRPLLRAIDKTMET